MRKGARKRTGKPRNTRSVKRVRNKRRPNYRMLFSLFAMALLVSCAVSYTFQTPSLSIEKVTIDGAKLVDRKSLDKIANTAIGKNIILVDKSRVVSRINCLSEIECTEMGRSFPDKVWIRVKERQPSAVITNGKQYCLVQDDGFAFHFTKGPVAGIPLLKVANCGSIKEGRKCGSRNAASALEVARQARKNGIKVNKISVDPLGYICLNIESGFYVKMGPPDEISNKMSKLRHALACRPSFVKDAEYFDISDPSAIVWKPKKTAGTAS